TRDHGLAKDEGEVARTDMLNEVLVHEAAAVVKVVVADGCVHGQRRAVQYGRQRGEIAMRVIEVARVQHEIGAEVRRAFEAPGQFAAGAAVADDGEGELVGERHTVPDPVAARGNLQGQASIDR